MNKVDEEEKIARAVGDKTRLNILKLLNKLGPLSTSELTEKLNKHRSTIIRHILILQDAGLITKNSELSYTYTITSRGKKFLELASTEGSVKIEVPVKKRRVFSFNILRNLLHIPTLIFLSLGFIGMFAPVEVSILSRILWFIIFTLISFLWEIFIKRL